jgi:YD repeat-containing protein
MIRCILRVLAALLLWQVPAAHADNIQYAYDEIGRLIQATNATSGEVVTYTYDAVGNITSQIAKSLNELSITHFAPQQGPPGVQVTIHGTGFSTTESDNTVRFNGTSATVVAASSTQLVVVVPANASTGPLSVQVGTASATGGTFTITASSGLPTITAVLPAAGAAGSTVSILGSNFELTADANRVRFGGAQAQVIMATATTITARIPANASSGRVRVTTLRGTALSPADFVVIPPGYTANQIVSSERIAADGTPSTLTFPAPNKIALRIFDGAAGDLLTVGISNLSFSSAILKVFAPDGALFASGTVSNTISGLQLPKLILTGTYTVVTEAGFTTGSAALAIFRPLEKTLTVNAPATAVVLTPSGRRALLSFDGSENQYVQLTLSGVTVANARVSLLKPDGSVLYSTTFNTGGSTVQVALPSGGTYRVLIDPAGSIGGSLNVGVTTSAEPQLEVNGIYEINLTNQSPQSVTFRGGEGQYLALNVSTDQTQIRGASLKVLGPDGAQLATGSLVTNFLNGAYTGSGVVNIGPLQLGGTYTAVVQQTISGSGTVRFTLSTPATGTLTANSTTAASINTPGRGLLYTVSGLAGQQLTVRVSEKETQITAALITALRPDGSMLASVNLTTTNVSTQSSQPKFTGAASINMGPLPVAGDYKILVQQTGMGQANTGELRLDLTSPVAGQLTVSNTTEVNIGRPGQGLQYTFTANAEQILALRMEFRGLIKAAAVSVLDPEGILVATDNYFPSFQGSSAEHPEPGFYGSLIINLGPLPLSGTYTVLMRAAQWNGGPTPLALKEPGDIGTVLLTLSTPLTGALATNNTTSIPIQIPGQGLHYEFAGAAGQYMTLAVIEDQGSIAAANISVLTPDGATLTTTALRATAVQSGIRRSATINIGPLPVTGNYAVLLQQTSRGTDDVGTLELTPSTPLSGTLVPDQPVSSVSIGTAGRGLRYQFNGHAGEYLALVTTRGTSGITLAPVTVLKPDGSVYLTGNTEILNLGPLPVSGTYEVLVQQSSTEGIPSLGTVNLSLSRPVIGAISVGASATVPVSLRGQGILQTFTATAGDHVAAKVTVLPGSFISAAKLTFIAPGGLPIKSVTLTSGVAAELTLIAAPLSGTYAILVQQVTATAPGTGTFAVELSTPSTATGTSWNVNTATGGESANLTFAAAAGQSISLTLTELVLTPSTSTFVSVSVITPSGTGIYSSTCLPNGAGCVIALRSLPQTGTYTFRVQPAGQARMAFKATLTPALTGALTAGVASSINLSPAGQVALLSFQGVAGRSVALNLSNVSTTPANVVLSVQVINSAGTILVTEQSSSALTLNLPNLTDDIYSVWIVPGTPATAALQVTLQTAAIETLPVDGSAWNVSSASPGQRIYFRFAATAGQSIGAALSGLTLTPSSSNQVFISIARPDGVSMYSGACTATGQGCVAGLRNLPQTGTYVMTVQPNGPATMAFTATLSQAITGSLSPNVPLSVNLSSPGQAAQLSFAVASDTAVALSFSGITTVPANTALSVQVFNSAGTVVASATAASAATLNISVPEADSYSVWIVPGNVATSTLQVTLHPGVTAALLDDGTAVSLATTAPGQFAHLTFSALAGESVSLVLASLTMIPSATGFAQLNIVKPDGTQLTGASCPVTGVGCVVGLRNLPQSGLYAVTVQPIGMARMSFDATRVSAATGSISPSVPLTLNLATRGQAALVHFTTANQAVVLRLTGITTTPPNTALSVQVYNSSGVLVTSGSALSTLTLNVPNAAPDTYAIWIVPTAPAASSLQVSY